MPYTTQKSEPVKISLRKIVFSTGCATAALLSGCMSSNSTGTAVCPQLRGTELAPAAIAAQNNPFRNNPQAIAAGQALYQGSVKPVACVECHGKQGEANGPMATMFNPPQRNFACSATMSNISDGQLHWIIRNGSIATSMPAFDKLSDTEIWQLVAYIRTFATDTPG